MSIEFSPFLRFFSKTTYFINSVVAAYDCRILYVLNGEGRIECNGTEYDLVPNTLIYIPYSLWYHIKSDKELYFYTINFDFCEDYKNIKPMTPTKQNDFESDKILHTIPHELQTSFASAIHIKNATWAEPIFDELYIENLNLVEGYTELQSALLKILLIKIFRHLCLPLKENEICLKIKNEINANLKTSIKDIAQKLNYHPYYLNAVFKKNENISLQKYLIRQKLMTSEKLLATTKMTLTEISDFCGFSSHAHFSAAFKKKNNLTPAAYRKLV